MLVKEEADGPNLPRLQRPFRADFPSSIPCTSTGRYGIKLRHTHDRTPTARMARGEKGPSRLAVIVAWRLSTQLQQRKAVQPTLQPVTCWNRLGLCSHSLRSSAFGSRIGKLLGAKRSVTAIDIQPEDSAVFERTPSTGRITHRLRRLMTQQGNACSVCGCMIPHGRPAFAGYEDDDRPIYVGACCDSHLSELATPVYIGSNLDVRVENGQKLWRYMDFAKFTALLAQRGLYFPRADTFEDAFEGAAGLISRRGDWDRFYLNFFREAVRTVPGSDAGILMSDELIEKDARRLLGDLSRAALEARTRLVSCWHANDGESEALWRLYSPPNTIGVAVQTTVDALWNVLADHPSGVVGRIHYLNYSQTFASLNDRIFFKRKSLGHESEVRAVLPNNRETPIRGQLVACDLKNLIFRVVVSPFSPNWFSDVLRETIARYGYDLPVQTSELLEQPFF